MNRTDPGPRPTRLFVISAIFVALGFVAVQVLPPPAGNAIGLALCVPAVVFAVLFIVALFRRRGLD